MPAAGYVDDRAVLITRPWALPVGAWLLRRRLVLGSRESGGCPTGDPQSSDGLAVGGELPTGLLLQKGTAVAVGEQPFWPRFSMRSAAET